MTIDYSFNTKSQRYYDKTNGKFISRNTVKETINQNLKNKAQLASTIAESYTSNEITAIEFEQLMAKLIKNTYIQHYKIGKPDLDNRDKELMRQRIIEEYVYLRRFILDLPNLSTNQINARAKSYFTNQGSFNEGSRVSYRESGWLWEKRVTSIAEHCAECVTYASLSWQPIGTLPAIATRSSCLSNCKCSFSFSKSVTRPR